MRAFEPASLIYVNAAGADRLSIASGSKLHIPKIE
jgi:hypothetical protein